MKARHLARPPTVSTVWLARGPLATLLFSCSARLDKQTWGENYMWTSNDGRLSLADETDLHRGDDAAGTVCGGAAVVLFTSKHVRTPELQIRGVSWILPLRAMTLLAGFMMALSAEMGRRMGLLGSAMSMMTTCACSPTFSRMQMNLSDSMVRVLNPMLAGLIPRFWS